MYDTKSLEESKKYGIVSVNEENKVIDFVEKPSNPKSTLASVGIYLYPKHIVKLFDE